MKRKIIPLVLCVIATSTTLFGCGKAADKETEKVSKTEEKSEAKSEKKSEEKEEKEEIKYLWKNGQKEAFSYDFKVDECENTYSIKNDNIEGDIKICYEGHEPFLVRMFNSDELPDGITEIAQSDVNFDGFTDLIVLGIKDGESYPWVFIGEENYKYSEEDLECTTFYAREEISDAIIKYFGANFTTDNIIAFLSSGLNNGSIASYEEGYAAVINFYESINPGGMGYELIQFDEDDIPELIVDNSGYGMTMYTFKDGTLSAPMVSWAYGAGGNHGYEYSPHNNSIRNYNTDFAGAIMNIGFATILDNKLDWNYCVIEIYFEDKNGNGSPDEDEYSEDGPVEVSYECYTDENLTEAEIEAKANGLNGLDYEEMYGSKSASQVLSELGISEFKVWHITKKSFKALGDTYKLKQTKAKGNQITLELSKGNDSIKSSFDGESAKFYLFERPDEKAFLYAFVRNDDQSKLYIYNLNLGSLNEPIEFDSDFSLYNGDISDSTDFMLQAYNDVLVDTAIQQSFTISELGTPVQNSDTAYFITKDSMEERAKISEIGDDVVSTKDFSCYSTKDLDDGYVYADETTDFKAGEVFHLYKYVYEFGFAYHIYLVNDDGDMIEFDLYSDDGVIKRDKSLVGFSDDLFISDIKLVK